MSWTVGPMSACGCRVEKDDPALTKYEDCCRARIVYCLTHAKAERFAQLLQFVLAETGWNDSDCQECGLSAETIAVISGELQAIQWPGVPPKAAP